MYIKNFNYNNNTCLVTFITNAQCSLARPEPSHPSTSFVYWQMTDHDG